MPAKNFLNTVTSASSIGEFMWAEKFIHQFKDELIPVYKEEVVNLSFAFIDFYKGRFEDSLKNLAKINLELCHFEN